MIPYVSSLSPSFLVRHVFIPENTYSAKHHIKQLIHVSLRPLLVVSEVANHQDNILMTLWPGRLQARPEVPELL